MGRFDGFMCLNSAERYEPEMNRWAPIALMHEWRGDASVTTLCEKVNGLCDYRKQLRLESGEQDKEPNISAQRYTVNKRLSFPMAQTTVGTFMELSQ